MSKISTIFFDIDNTILNHSGAEEKAVAMIKNKYFPKINIEDFQNVWKTASKKNWKRYEVKGLSFGEQRTQRIIDVWDAFGKKISDSCAKGVFQKYLKFYEKFWKSFSHVPSVLRKINKYGIQIGILTNGNKDQQVKKMKQIGIYKFIKEDMIVVSEEVGFAKPQQEIFLHAQKLANVPGQNIMVVGDNFSVDIEPALKLNWKGVLVDHFGRKLNGKSINDFRKILKLTKDK